LNAKEAARRLQAAGFIVDAQKEKKVAASQGLPKI